jgi:hypothetical protein
MSEAWPEAVESEAYGEAYGDAAGEASGEAAGEGEGEAYGEAARSDDAQARQRQIVYARQQRQAQLRRRQVGLPPQVRTPATGPAPGQVIRAVRSLDLETKVAQDSLRRALEEANRRAARATWATVASTAASQVFDSFEKDLGNHPMVRAGIRGAPLLLLSPEKQRRGFEGFIYDPRVIGSLVLGGIFVAGRFRSSAQGVDHIDIADPGTLFPFKLFKGDEGKLTAIARERNNNVVQTFVPTWSSSNDAILRVASDGTFKAQSLGSVTVTVTGDGRTNQASITVLDPLRMQGAPNGAGDGLQAASAQSAQPQAAAAQPEGEAPPETSGP